MAREERRELNGLEHRLLVWEAPPLDCARGERMLMRPTIVLLHGWLDLAWSFVRFAEALQAQLPLRIVAPDLRGHGATERVGRGGYYHFPDYVADVHALLETLPPPVLLLGHSMGGTIAALAAACFPERIEKLVLVEGLGPPTQSDTEPPDRMRRWIEDVRQQRAPTPMTLEQATRRLGKAYPNVAPELVRLVAEKGTVGVEGGRVWAFDPLHRTRSPAPFAPEIFRSFLRRIACPVLLVEGSESPFRQWVNDDRESEIARLSKLGLEGAGHMIHLEQPERLAREVAAFLLQGAASE